MRKPGLGIFDAFNEVGLGVKAATGGSQLPWVSQLTYSRQIDFVDAPMTPDGGQLPDFECQCLGLITLRKLGLRPEIQRASWYSKILFAR